MDYIQKIEIQTEEISEAKLLENNIIIYSEPVTVDTYNGHLEEFLSIGDDYNDGYTQLNKLQK